MSTLEILVARAREAWDADDGQSSAEDIAARVVARAVAETLVHRSNAALATRLVVARLEQPVASAAEDPAIVARRNEKAAAKAEWGQAVRSAERWVEVYDDDGGTSRALRTPTGWTHEGCATLGQFLRLRLPWIAAEEQAEKTSAEAEAAAFVASLPTLSAEAAKTAYWALSGAARSSGAIRALPKAVRRQF